MGAPVHAPPISIVVVGDELLDGHTPDKNSAYLARVLRKVGATIECITLVRDDVASIAHSIGTELGRSKPRIVFTIGGIGGTPDDVTYQGIAAALDLDLVAHPRILQRVHRSIRELISVGQTVDHESRQALERMADVPSGSRMVGEGWLSVISCDVEGGVEEEGAVVSVLPGHPPHFYKLVDEVVVPRFRARWAEGTPVRCERELEHWLPEAVLAGALSRVSIAFPGVRVGSYPGEPSVLRLSGSTKEEVEDAAAYLASELSALAD